MGPGLTGPFARDTIHFATKLSPCGWVFLLLDFVTRFTKSRFSTGYCRFVMDSLLPPILLFAACATGLSLAMLAAGTFLGPNRSSAVKRMPYESGMDPVHDTHRKFDIRFHLVAIAFLLFDVELLFLYPWAVASRDDVHGLNAAVAEAATNGMEGMTRALIFGEVLVFVALLAAGLVYAWKRGVFQWR